MKGSILIFGSSGKHREDAINEILVGLDLTRTQKAADLFLVNKEKDKKSIGIGQIREAKRFISEKPLSGDNKAVVIEKAHLLTIQAQNALLKVLEEPPAYATIILSTKSEDDLLETIVSRCKRVNLKSIVKTIAETKDSSIDKNINDIQDIINKEVGERLSMVETLAKMDKEDLINLLETWILQLRTKHSFINNKRLEELINLRNDLQYTNLNTRLGLEKVFLQL